MSQWKNNSSIKRSWKACKERVLIMLTFKNSCSVHWNGSLLCLVGSSHLMINTLLGPKQGGCLCCSVALRNPHAPEYLQRQVCIPNPLCNFTVQNIEVWCVCGRSLCMSLPVSLLGRDQRLWGEHSLGSKTEKVHPGLCPLPAIWCWLSG